MLLFIGLIVVVVLVYMVILFVIVFYGDCCCILFLFCLCVWVYSFFLVVYCISWIFFGVVGQVIDQFWLFLLIYFGLVLLMLFVFWVLQKMIMISKQENIIFIVDFIVVCYGKLQVLVVVVVLICMVGVLFYIVL